MNADVLDGSIADSTTLNLYTYVNGNPISFVDPFGMSADRGNNAPIKTDSTSGQSNLHYEHYKIGGLDMAPTFGPYDDDFPYDPNESATFDDYISWCKWGIMGFGSSFAWWLPDASVSYNHYRDNTGTDLWIDYKKAYNEDSVIKKYLDNEILIMMAAGSYFYNSNAGTSFEMIGDLFSVPNGDTENWQKTIGAHYAYAYGKISIDEDSNTATMKVTFTMEDMYNFNKSQVDIASGTPDDVNGRFSVLGWAKPFKSYGSFDLKVSWDISNPNDYEFVTGVFDR